MTTKTILISVSPWCGRKTLTQHLRTKENTIKILNLSTGNFSRLDVATLTDENLKKNSKNINFPQNMVDFIYNKFYNNEYDYIFIGQQLPIFNHLTANKIPYVLVQIQNTPQEKNKLLEIIKKDEIKAPKTSNRFIDDYFDKILPAMDEQCAPVLRYILDSNGYFDEELLNKITKDYKNMFP
jgi:hypothetical protein